MKMIKFKMIVQYFKDEHDEGEIFGGIINISKSLSKTSQKKVTERELKKLLAKILKELPEHIDKGDKYES